MSLLHLTHHTTDTPVVNTTKHTTTINPPFCTWRGPRCTCRQQTEHCPPAAAAQLPPGAPQTTWCDGHGPVHFTGLGVYMHCVQGMSWCERVRATRASAPSSRPSLLADMGRISPARQACQPTLLLTPPQPIGPPPFAAAVVVNCNIHCCRQHQATHPKSLTLTHYAPPLVVQMPPS